MKCKHPNCNNTVIKKGATYCSPMCAPLGMFSRDPANNKGPSITKEAFEKEEHTKFFSVRISPKIIAAANKKRLTLGLGWRSITEAMLVRFTNEEEIK